MRPVFGQPETGRARYVAQPTDVYEKMSNEQYMLIVMQSFSEQKPLRSLNPAFERKQERYAWKQRLLDAYEKQLLSSLMDEDPQDDTIPAVWL